MKKGFLETSIREIAEACGMGIGTLYHYIGKKEDILNLFCDTLYSWMTQLAEEISSGLAASLTPTEKLRLAIRKYLQYIDSNQDAIVFWYQSTKNLQQDARKLIFEQEARLIDMFERLVSDICQDQEFEIKDIYLASQNIVVLCDMWAFRRWELKRKYTLDTFIEHQTEIIINSLCGR